MDSASVHRDSLDNIANTVSSTCKTLLLNCSDRSLNERELLSSYELVVDSYINRELSGQLGDRQLVVLANRCQPYNLPVYYYCPSIVLAVY